MPERERGRGRTAPFFLLRSFKVRHYLVLFLLCGFIAAAQAGDSMQTSAIDGISITPDNQILVELTPDDTASANLFDLNGRTLVFTPDGEGGYSREVRPLAWEEDIGAEVADGSMIALENFTFDFAGQSWDSFHISRHGLLTFGRPLTYSYYVDGRFETMREIAAEFVAAPTISPLYTPGFGGFRIEDDPSASRHVTRWSDRVVVTWSASETQFRGPGVPPRPNRFQAVLYADGSIRFNYADVTAGGGIVGLFPNNEAVKGDLIARVVDGTDPELPGYLDVLEAAIYASDTDAVILEFTTREPIPEPSGDRLYSYRLYFDTDEPYWPRFDVTDEDLGFAINIGAGGVTTWRGKVLTRDADNRIALSVDISDLSETSVAIIASASEFDSNSWVRGDWSSPTQVQLPAPTPMVDLSQSDSRFSRRQNEVFHYRSPPDTAEIACRVIDVLGDRFDLFVFHNEFKTDNQEAGTPARGDVSRVKGIGRPLFDSAPCGDGRLQHYWARPVRAQLFIDEHFDNELVLFAHEFIHVWAAYVSYEKNGKREPLYGDVCQCHWRADLHTPTAFPWRGGDVGSIMADLKVEEGIFGGFWHENGDGTFSPINHYPIGGGPSWLDLYLMGLANASEVPGMFILRNLKRVGEGVYTGDKEIISIEQIIAAEGPREPSAAESQKDFNAGFVYLLEPGQTPSPDLLDLHAKYLKTVKEYWSHITGGRSHITTQVNVARHATLENPRSGSFQSESPPFRAGRVTPTRLSSNSTACPTGRATGRSGRRRWSVSVGIVMRASVCCGTGTTWGRGHIRSVRCLMGSSCPHDGTSDHLWGRPIPAGLSGTFDLPNFPTSGETTLVQWEESLQNFVITDGQPNTGGGYNRVSGIDARLENPSLGSAQSGLGAISGWGMRGRRDCH